MFAEKSQSLINDNMVNEPAAYTLALHSFVRQVSRYEVVLYSAQWVDQATDACIYTP